MRNTTNWSGLVKVPSENEKLSPIPNLDNQSEIVKKCEHEQNDTFDTEPSSSTYGVNLNENETNESYTDDSLLLECGCGVDFGEQLHPPHSKLPNREFFKGAKRCESSCDSCAAGGRLCPSFACTAAEFAKKKIVKLTKDSQLFGEKNFRGNIEYFSEKDIEIGKTLGEGGFCVVSECTVIQNGKFSSSDEQQKAKNELAIKYLRHETMTNGKKFRNGAADLVSESCFLQKLQHPYIIKLHGVTAGSFQSNIATGKQRGYFIVLDRLFFTLEHLLTIWHRDRNFNRGFQNMRRTKKEFKRRKWNELVASLEVAYDIADVMGYLHSLNVVYRDLKPGNIGFNKDGVLKLFDFGLAKELKLAKKREDGRYMLTGNSGSKRYMAPEVAKRCPYEKSVDVYSFGILLWELCSAEKPFLNYDSGMHMEFVVIGGERPKMDADHVKYWPSDLQLLMKQCWSPSPFERPSFESIKQTLSDILSTEGNIADKSSREQEPLLKLFNRSAKHTNSGSSTRKLRSWTSLRW